MDIEKEGDMASTKKEASVKEKVIYKGGGGGSVYGLGLMGSLIYFITRADSVQEFLLGLVKSIVWPGLLVYRALELLNF